MSRNGKIARLPGHIREQINRRSQKGERGVPLAHWLNGSPDKVHALLFPQSLSGWFCTKWIKGSRMMAVEKSKNHLCSLIFA